jgi:hypothetical protein
MLVKRWGILCSAMPQGITIKKTVALVNAMAKLHNFCIERVDGTNTAEGLLSKDMSNLMNSELGYVGLENADGSEVDLPVQLMNDGHHHHFDDIPEPQRHHCSVGGSIDLSMPRTQLLDKVAESNMQRPKVKRGKT